MNLLDHQMKMAQSKRMLGRHIWGQFLKTTKFGRLMEQCELILQQFHAVIFRSVEGLTVRGCPRLMVDVSDVQYITSPAFDKWTRKNENADKYAEIRGRLSRLDIEAEGNYQRYHSIYITQTNITIYYLNFR